MGEVPSYASEITSADKYVRKLPPVRISISQKQFILELQRDWDANESETVRGMIEFCARYMPEIAKREGSPLNGKTRGAANLLIKQRAALEWSEIKDDLYRSYYTAIKTGHERIRDELLEALAERAKEKDIEWPPPSPDLDPIMHRSDLRHVHDRVISLITKNESCRVSLREVCTSTGKSKKYLIPRLKELEDTGYVSMSEEKRSGQATIWVEVPMIEISQ